MAADLIFLLVVTGQQFFPFHANLWSVEMIADNVWWNLWLSLCISHTLCNHKISDFTPTV